MTVSSHQSNRHSMIIESFCTLSEYLYDFMRSQEINPFILRVSMVAKFVEEKTRIESS